MLHARATVREELLDEVFASTDLSVSMPKYRIPEKEHDPRHAYQVVADELMLDGNSRQNLATFCQTWLEPEVHSIMDLTIDKNMIDKDEYPQTAEIEGRCVHMLADLWNAPDAAGVMSSVSGALVGMCTSTYSQPDSPEVEEPCDPPWSHSIVILPVGPSPS